MNFGMFNCFLKLIKAYSENYMLCEKCRKKLLDLLTMLYKFFSAYEEVYMSNNRKNET